MPKKFPNGKSSEKKIEKLVIHLWSINFSIFQIILGDLTGHILSKVK